MAATKTGVNLFSSQVVTAGTGRGAVTSSIQTLTTSYGSVITGEMITGVTGPTTAGIADLLVSDDATNFHTLGSVACGLVAATTYPFSLGVPAPIMYCKLVLGGNSGGSSITVNADQMNLTGI